MGKCTTLNRTAEELDANDTSLVAVQSTASDNTTLVNDIRAKLKGDYNVSLPSLAVGTTATDISSVAFDYQISGVRYSKAAVAAGTPPGTTVIPQATFGALALDIDAAGTISVAEAAANATGYASAALALAGIPAVASGKARMGTVSTTLSSGTFTLGTTEFSAVGTTTVYTDGQTAFEAIGAAVA